MTETPSVDVTNAQEGNVSSIEENRGFSEKHFRGSIFFAFYWIMFGISIIYGFRLYYDDPLHPSFLPIVFVCFSVVTEFIVVLTINFVVGEIKFKAPGFEFEGASGPIVLWIVCFLAIVLSLTWLHKKFEVADVEKYEGRSISKLVISGRTCSEKPNKDGQQVNE